MPIKPDEPAKRRDRRPHRAGTSGWLDSVVGVLNAVLGDYLAERGNDLATELSFVHQGQPLPLTQSALRDAYPEATDKLCVLIHGLSCTERTWLFPTLEEPQTYGSLLRAELDFTPLYLRYNTGLHISQNGRAFAAALEQLLAAYPRGVNEITLIGHSMGGLVIRSGCHYAEGLGHRWLGKVRRAIYLGSPHLGAPAEKAGNAVSAVLRMVDDPFVRLTKKLIDRRSVGIKDLRYANLVDQDWHGHDPDAPLSNQRTVVPLQPHMDHYVVAGTLTKTEAHPLALLFGDALVRVPSATGQSRPDDPSPGFPRENLRLFPGLHHMSLAHHRDVYEQLRDWCGDSSDEGAATS